MVGFYCVTAFQIFLSILIKNRYFKYKDAVIFIVTPLDENDYDIEALYEIGFSNVIIIDTEEKANNVSLKFDELFFYSIFCAYSDSLKRFKTDKFILGYEGITSFQLKHWSASNVKRFDLDGDIDEIWLPDADLLLDKEYLNKTEVFSVKLGNTKEDEKLINQLNKIFKYVYTRHNYSVVFMDRYLSKYMDIIFNAATERLLTEAIYHGNGGNIAIKRHPYDLDYKEKYKYLKNADVIEDNVPWELIYLNDRLNGVHIDKYIIYNSFAPINIALLFEDNDFECMCVEPLLDLYAQIKNSYLDADITNKILSSFSKKYKVEISYIRTISELKAFGGINGMRTDDELWNRCEDMIMGESVLINLLELRAFRLQLDCALLNMHKEDGFYYFTKKNRSARLTKKILEMNLPRFKETDEKMEADLIVDTDESMLDLNKDFFDVSNMHVIEGYPRGSQVEYEQHLLGLIEGKDDIYIWGASKSNSSTYALLNMAGKSAKVKYIFDSYASGECYGIKIIPFSKELVKPNSFILICANIAYPEISKILVENGFVEERDFALGVCIGNR